MSRLHQFILLCLIACCLPLETVQAQAGNNKRVDARQRSIEQQQFRLAQRYIRSRDYENAVRILEPLYNRTPGNDRYYRELLKAYLQLSMLEPAEKLINLQKAKDPDNPQFKIDYGNLLYKSGDKAEALTLWNSVADEHGQRVQVFRSIAAAMINNRLFDEAIRIYRKGYDQHPQEHSLLRDLANFHTRRLEFSQGLSAYVEYIRKSPANHHYAIRQVLAFRIEGEQVTTLQTEIDKYAETYKTISEIQLLAAKFHQKHQFYQQALAIYNELENSGSNGKYLFEFGRAMQGDQQYELAIEAYQQITIRFPNSPHLLQAYIGAASCNLEMANQTRDQQFARQALDMITSVREKYPKHHQIGNLSILEGDIYREFFFDLDKAIGIYLDVAGKHRKVKKLRNTAYMKAGKSFIMRGDLGNAAKTFKKISSKEEKPDALFHLAKISYYQAEYDSVLTQINTIIQQEGLSSTIINDALEIQTLIGHREKAAEALKLYAKADWLLFQQKKPQALTQLRSALATAPPAGFRIRILLDASRLSSELDLPQEAIEFCQRILDDSDLNLYASEAIYQMALIVDTKLDDPARAFTLYDRLLQAYPDSQFANLARTRLKEIRNNHPDLIQ